MGEDRSRKKDNDYWWRRCFLKDTYQGVSQSMGTRRDTHTHADRAGEIFVHCFSWVSALGHLGGQEFGSLTFWPPHCYSRFLCEAPLLYFSVFYDFVLFYGLLVSLLFEGVDIALGWWRELKYFVKTSWRVYMLLKITCVELHLFTCV